jgi:hypothetical protein
MALTKTHVTIQMIAYQNHQSQIRRNIDFYLFSSLRIAPAGDLEHSYPFIDAIEKVPTKNSKKGF